MIRALALMAALLAAPALAQTPPPDPAARGAPVSEALVPINAARAAEGLPPLTIEAHLQAAAVKHAQDMARQGYFDHTGRDGSSFSQRIAAEGYSVCYGAENIALGYPDAAAAVAGWLQSAGHRRNVLLRQATHLGVGRAEAHGRAYWVALFANTC